MSRVIISIVIPCFNAEETIAETLNSLPHNSASGSLEVIVIDDGSTDRSAAVVKQARPDAILISQPNEGVSAARNCGLSIARGDWIQFLDADDALLPHTLEHRLELAHQSQADVVVTDWIEFSSNAGPASRALQRESNRTFANRSAAWQTCRQGNEEIGCATSFWAPPAAVFYSRSIVQKVEAFRTDLPIIQDARFLFDAAFHGAKFAHLSEPGALYRISPNSLSRQSKTAFWLDCLRNGQQIEQLWTQRYVFLSDEHNAALQKIFSTSTQGLLWEGHPSALLAAKSLYGRGGQLSCEQRYSLQLLRRTGTLCTKSILTILHITTSLTRRLKKMFARRHEYGSSAS